MIYESIKDIQDQIDSLAEVVLQNRRGLDLLTADKGGICLALQERCCFYTNKSGVVCDRIRKHQEDLEERRRQLFDNPVLSLWNGILLSLLPFLGPLVGFFLISCGPWALCRVTNLVKEHVDSAFKKWRSTIIA